MEFALIMVPILYLVLGVITYGYILSFRQSLSQGAAEGARAAAIAPAGFTATQQKGRAEAAVSDGFANYGLTCSGGKMMNGTRQVGTCTITVAACPNDATLKCVSVDVDYLYNQNPLVPLPGMGIVTPSDLRYTAVAQVNS